MQAHGAPDGAAVVVAPAQGQGHGQVLHRQQQVPQVHPGGLEHVPPHAGEGIHQDGDHIGQRPALTAEGAEQQPPEQCLFDKGHEHHQQHGGGSGGEEVLLEVLHGDGILYRQGQQPRQEAQCQRPHQTGDKGEAVFRQPVHQQGKPVPQEGPEHQQSQGEEEGVVHHVGLGRRSLRVSQQHLLGPGVEIGEHKEVQGEEHPAPLSLRGGHLGPPGSLCHNMSLLSAV